jgi:hypothetical protein
MLTLFPALSLAGQDGAAVVTLGDASEVRLENLGDTGDSNDDGELDISDAIHTLGYLFLGFGDIPAPGPGDCGIDPTLDELSCESFAPCR